MKLTSARTDALRYLGKDGLTVERLHRKLGRHESACRRLVDGMERAGLVTVQEDLVKATDLGLESLAATTS